MEKALAERGIAPSAEHPVLVAYSGGADSTALLHVAHGRWPNGVEAVHVHHGLQPQAEGFVRHCQAQCEQWGVPLHVYRLQLRCLPGDSVEEVARQARYAALAHVAQQRQAAVVLLAHHATDQLESVLLALSRGAGVHGLAGMPAERTVQGQRMLRPWLALTGEQIRQHVQRHGLSHVEDPSNADVRWTRNRIRLRVLPVLLAAFPALEATAARSARHCAEAAALLEGMADADLQQVGHPPRLAELQRLPPARLAQALRLWLRQEAGRFPATAPLQQLVAQIRAARTRGHRLDVPVAGGRVRRAGEVLVFERGSPPGRKRAEDADGLARGEDEA